MGTALLSVVDLDMEPPFRVRAAAKASRWVGGWRGGNCVRGVDLRRMCISLCAIVWPMTSPAAY